MKAVVLFLSIVAWHGYALADDPKPRAGRLPAGCEVAMLPRMRITATTSVGTIAITAVDELTRSYTWDGATRAVEMSPRPARFFGSLGLFHDAQGEHWRDHHGITRCFTEEGQQAFKTVEEAMKWSKERDWLTFVYRDDGLMVGWNKFLQSMRRIQSNYRLHLMRAAVPPQPLRLQAPLRHCWDCPGGAGTTLNSQELHHAQAQVRTGPPPPLKRTSPHPSGPPLWDQLTQSQRQELARLVGQLLARRLRTADRREVTHDSQ